MESQAQQRNSAKVLRSLPSGWRNSTMPMEQLSFRCGDSDIELAYRLHRDGRFRLLCDDQEHIIDAYDCGAGAVDLDNNGRRLQFTVKANGNDWLIHSAAGDLVLEQQARFPDRSLDANTGGLTAPMPGSVLATEVATGAAVAKGDLLLIMEAMKMEHRITAPRDGVIETIHVAVGDQVDNGQLLVSMAEE
jgi:propionyl-CoA carboxylase alpha chain